MTMPTPKLRAEDQASKLACLINSVPRLSDGQHVSATAGDIRVYAARVRRKAFEEAAELAAIECCDECCRIVPKNIRALAKEKPGMPDIRHSMEVAWDGGNGIVKRNFTEGSARLPEFLADLMRRGIRYEVYKTAWEHPLAKAEEQADES